MSWIPDLTLLTNEVKQFTHQQKQVIELLTQIKQLLEKQTK